MYYSIGVIALYFTALLRIFIPVEVVYSQYAHSSPFEIFIRQSVWAVLTLVFAPYYFLVIMTKDNTNLIMEMVQNLLKD